MAQYIIPSVIRKDITFRRLSNKACTKYEIYAQYEDETAINGIRIEKIDEFDNPSEPTIYTRRIPLEHVKDPTWTLPLDAFYDRNHHFRLFQNNHALSSIYYNYNRINRLFTLDTQLVEYNVSDDMELEYFVDVIKKTYTSDKEFKIIIKPTFSQEYMYGDHNIIV